MSSFNMKQGLADCRKAYEEKTLQMQMPVYGMPGFTDDHGVIDGSCTYFHNCDGKVYTCAVGAMFKDRMNEIYTKGLNEQTSAPRLIQTLYPEEKYNLPTEALLNLQQRHDDVVSARGNNHSKPEIKFAEECFLELLTELEKKYA